MRPKGASRALGPQGRVRVRWTGQEPGSVHPLRAGWPAPVGAGGRPLGPPQVYREDLTGGRSGQVRTEGRPPGVVAGPPLPCERTRPTGRRTRPSPRGRPGPPTGQLSLFGGRDGPGRGAREGSAERVGEAPLPPQRATRWPPGPHGSKAVEGKGRGRPAPAPPGAHPSSHSDPGRTATSRARTSESQSAVAARTSSTSATSTGRAHVCHPWQ